jgi:hypothetical protein
MRKGIEIITCEREDITYFFRRDGHGNITFINFHCGTEIDLKWLDENMFSDRLLEIYNTVSYGKMNPGFGCIKKAVRRYIKCFLA